MAITVAAPFFCLFCFVFARQLCENFLQLVGCPFLIKATFPKSKHSIENRPAHQSSVLESIFGAGFRNKHVIFFEVYVSSWLSCKVSWPAVPVPGWSRAGPGQCSPAKLQWCRARAALAVLGAPHGLAADLCGSAWWGGEPQDISK